MLILLIRIVFVLACLVIGHNAGRYFYTGAFNGDMPDWFGIPLGFSIAITLIAAELAFRRHFTRSLIALLLGLGASMALSALTLTVLHLVVQNRDLVNNLDAPIALILSYLVTTSVLAHADRFRLILPFVEFRADHIELGALVLDASGLRDSRLITLITNGIVGQRLIVHRNLVRFIEQQAIAADPIAQAQGRRALENLAALRGLGGQIRVDVDNTEIPNVRTLHEVLIGVARLEGARLLTNNGELAARARAEDLGVVFLNELGNAFAPSIRVGENLDITIEKAGDQQQQGVGHLDDGSMVLVKDADRLVGQRLRCTIVRMHHNANGRMIFAERSDLRRESQALIESDVIAPSDRG
jgi:uncharacterized protein YacL